MRRAMAALAAVTLAASMGIAIGVAPALAATTSPGTVALAVLVPLAGAVRPFDSRPIGAVPLAVPVPHAGAVCELDNRPAGATALVAPLSGRCRAELDVCFVVLGRRPLAAGGCPGRLAWLVGAHAWYCDGRPGLCRRGRTPSAWQISGRSLAVLENDVAAGTGQVDALSYPGMQVTPSPLVPLRSPTWRLRPPSCLSAPIRQPLRSVRPTALRPLQPLTGYQVTHGRPGCHRLRDRLLTGSRGPHRSRSLRGRRGR